MKKSKVILKIFILMIILLFTVFYTTSKAAFWSNMFSDADDFLQTGKEEAENAGDATDKDVGAMISDIYSVLFQLGVAATVITGGILGIKFMLASAEDKAKVKESMVPYVIGCIVIYGAFGIWRLVIEVLSAID